MPAMPLTSVPASHGGAISAIKERMGENAHVWTAELDRRPTLVAVGLDRLAYASSGGAARSGIVVGFAKLTSIEAVDRMVTFTLRSGWTGTIDFGDSAKAASLIDAVTSARRSWESGDADAAIADRESVRLSSATGRVLIVTMNDVPGYDIGAVHGAVFGLVVLTRNVFAHIGAEVRTIVGGEVGGYTKLLAESRDEARERLAAEALKLGANAILAARFSCSEIGDRMIEITAYGTAATITPTYGT